MDRRKLRVLFLCAANICRSPTAEALLNEIEGCEAKSAGVCEGAVNVVTQELLDWAEVVFVMEYWMKKALLEAGWSVAPMKIKVLGVRDSYFFGNPALVKTLAEKLKIYGIIVSEPAREWQLLHDRKRQTRTASAKKRKKEDGGE